MNEVYGLMCRCLCFGYHTVVFGSGKLYCFSPYAKDRDRDFGFGFGSQGVGWDGKERKGMVLSNGYRCRYVCVFSVEILSAEFASKSKYDTNIRNVYEIYYLIFWVL